MRMPTTSFRQLLAALGLAVITLLFFAQSNCANSDQPTDTGGDAGDDAGDAGPLCGELEMPCCGAIHTCKVGGFCNEGTCKKQHTNDIGKPCSSNDQCQSGLCGYVQFPDVSMVDAGEGGTTSFPDGGGPPSSSVCTTGCNNDTQCEPGWLCNEIAVGIGVCQCTANPEVCDGKDNNCNGIIDDEPFVDQDCTANVGMGIPEVCKKGKCDCVNTCSGTCVDINNDPMNCGKCGVTCDPNVQACKKGSCVCGNMSGTVQMCGSQCVDTASDKNNCGGCGKVCNYTCAQSQCGPTTLYSGYTSGMIADATTVYWISGFPNNIVSCPLAGCMTPKTVVSNIGYTNQLALANGNIFWGDTNFYHINKCPTSGCTTPTLVYDQSNACPSPPCYISPQGIATDATNVYWTNSDQTVMKCPQTGCTTATKLTTDTYYINSGVMAVDGTNVIWANGTPTLVSCSTNGCASPTTISAGQYVNSMVATGGNVFWTTYSNAWQCSDAACLSPIILGGPSEPSPSGIATDGTNVYWANDTGKMVGGGIKKCKVGGCAMAPTQVIANRDYPTSLLLSGSNVLWQESSSSGALLEFAK